MANAIQKQSIYYLTKHYNYEEKKYFAILPNQRAVYYGSLLFDNTPVAYNAANTHEWYWQLWSGVRESLARTKAVFCTPFMVLL